jgi:hypothetical protein
MLRTRVTYANVMATIAVFIALGGTSYGLATGSIDSREIKNNSVHGNDIRNATIVSRDVKDGALLAEDFKAGQLPAGPAGAQGPQGARGAKGDTGAPGSIPATLPSGQTVRGAYAASGIATETRDVMRDAPSFPYRLAAEPDTHFIPVGGAPLAACPGTTSNPQAQSGHLCVYEHVSQNADTLVDDPAGTLLFGFVIQSSAVAAGQVQSRGSWAVTG